MKIKVKNTILYALCVLTASVVFTNCSDWLEAEPIKFSDDDNLNVSVRTDEYYAALREWKATPGLPQSFVWFDSWTGKLSGEGSLSGLPDSLTIASNWGQPKWGLSEGQKADMEFVQKVKGTKVVVTLFSENVGVSVPEDPIYNVGNSSDEAVLRPAIRKYAEALYDLVVENGYDGYDWDYEPTVGGNSSAYLWRNVVQRRIFVEELSYWFGRGATEEGRDRDGRKPAKPGLLFMIDGEVGGMWAVNMGKDWLTYYVDYFVHQAYGSNSISGTNGLENRVNGTLNAMSDWIDQGIITKEEVVRRIILCENFESYAGTGGGILLQSSYVHKPESGTHVGVDQQIGGFGIYRPGFDFNQGKGDYLGSPEYFFLRQGITNLYRIYNERKNIDNKN